MSTPEQIYSVGAITHYVKHLLEQAPLLQGVQIAGEVSNITYHGSGHVYFAIKDREAQLSCVMFSRYARQLDFRMQTGDKVVLTGNVSVYVPRGNYQLLVTGARKQGLGDLYQQFLALKAKLEKEGLFDRSRKRPIPRFPERIAVITSPTGAAIRDILQTLQRRYGRGEVIILPTIVQGQGGKASILRSLERAQTTGADVILLARGGGSIEDLWNFNEEAVARAVAASSIPVISGVGHETDQTIVDFVADLRASTPTAAAESAVPDRKALLDQLEAMQRQVNRGLQTFIDFKRQVLDDYAYRLEQSIGYQLNFKRQLLEDYERQLQQAMVQQLRQKRHQVDLLAAELKALDLTTQLDHGYTLTLKEGKRLQRGESLQPGDRIETVFADRRVRSQVEE